MTRPSRQKLLDTILYEAHTLAAYIDPALQRLDDSLAGWPTSTPGAGPASPSPIAEHNWCTEHPLPCEPHPDQHTTDGLCHFHPLPCSEHPPDQRSSLTERAALQGDLARAQLDLLDTALEQAQAAVSAVTLIATRWGAPSGRDVKATLLTVDESIHCAHCFPLGYRNVRAPGKTLCDYCFNYRERWRNHTSTKTIGNVPSARILALRDSRGGKIYRHDEERIRGEEVREAADRRRVDKAARKQQSAS
jgi:hypothetical protein